MYMYIYTYIYMCACVYLHAFACLCVCVCAIVCTCVWACVWWEEPDMINAARQRYAQNSKKKLKGKLPKWGVRELRRPLYMHRYLHTCLRTHIHTYINNKRWRKLLDRDNGFYKTNRTKSKENALIYPFQTWVWNG